MTKKILIQIFKEIKKEPKNYVYLVLLNLLIFASYAILGQIIFYFTNSSMDYFNMLSLSLKSIIGLVSFVSYLIIPTLPYAFFKLLIVSKIAKKKTPKKLFWRFYINNVLIFSFANIIVIIWLFFGSTLTPLWMIFYMLFTLIPIVFFIGSFTSIYHSLTVKENNPRMIKSALRFTSKKLSKYWTFLIPNVLAVIVFFVIWGIIGGVLSLLNLVQNVQFYNFIFSATFYALLLLISAFNQIFFYKITLGYPPE